MNQLLDEFRQARERNLEILKGLDLKPSDMSRKGKHPSLGIVTLRNHLSGWCSHDLIHIAQICRVMAKRYKNEIGPWLQYMRLVNS